MTDTQDRRDEQRHESPASLTYIRVIEEVTRTGITQSELGKVVGAATRSVQNWANGQNMPRGKSVVRLLDLHTIVSILADSYTDEGIDIWLHARNRNLDMQRPIDLLTAGKIDEVLAEARWVAGGM
ncbi:transcriptional regulator [Rhodococcoides fascians]|uniref:transcriptional regulator n=1 Tax=Rhodococcoides fascians TaxID=1828 RepID=UPI00050BE17C|nr:transcriptional regulator [Rhodococcus fascians]